VAPQAQLPAHPHQGYQQPQSGIPPSLQSDFGSLLAPPPQNHHQTYQQPQNNIVPQKLHISPGDLRKQTPAQPYHSNQQGFTAFLPMPPGVLPLPPVLLLPSPCNLPPWALPLPPPMTETKKRVLNQPPWKDTQPVSPPSKEASLDQNPPWAKGGVAARGRGVPYQPAWNNPQRNSPGTENQASQIAPVPSSGRTALQDMNNLKGTQVRTQTLPPCKDAEEV